MTNIQSQKEGKGPIEEVSFVAHRDPIFQTPIVDTTSAAGGNIAVDSGKVNFGPRGPGRLGIVVGQLNTTDPDGAGVFGTDASGNCVLDLNPIGAIQGTAATAITVTTGDSSAWTATVIYSDE